MGREEGWGGRREEGWRDEYGTEITINVQK